MFPRRSQQRTGQKSRHRRCGQHETSSCRVGRVPSDSVCGPVFSYFSLRRREEKKESRASAAPADAESALTVGCSASQISNQTPSSLAALARPSKQGGCRSAERRASMVRALDRYTSGKDVAYRFAPGWLLSSMLGPTTKPFPWACRVVLWSRIVL